LILKHFLGFIALIFLSLSVDAQREDITVNQISITEGLSQSTVTSLAIDRNGMLWVGTCNGLNVLDESRIVVVSDNWPFANEFSNNSIRSLHADAHNQLWIGSEEGIYLYNHRAKRKTKIYNPDWHFSAKMLKAIPVGDFTMLLNRQTKTLIINSKQEVVAEFSSGILEGANAYKVLGDKVFWISRYPYYLFTFDAKTLQVTKELLPDYLQKESLSSLDVSPNLTIIIAGSDEIAMRKAKSNTFHYHSLQSLGFGVN
jgi:hypothetical protein